MIEPALLCARLRARTRLSSEVIAAIEAALRRGTASPQQLLQDAGLSPQAIATLLAPPPSKQLGPEVVDVTDEATLEPVIELTPKRKLETVQDEPIIELTRKSNLPPRPQQAISTPAAPSTPTPVASAPAASDFEPSVEALVSRLIDITPRFEIQGEIAHGAMGRILAAWDLHLGRAVAIKVLHPQKIKDFDRVRFLEEAQVTGQLQHPNIMPVYELGRFNQQIAFVMRRIEGQSLKSIITALRKGEPEAVEKFPDSRIYEIFLKLCQAVTFAHQHGVVHRDLKPSNVMIGELGDVVLLDWGLCKIINTNTRSTRSTSERWQTVHGQIIGTPAYMAPEQAMGLVEEIDTRTDVYGLGAILYHLLTLRAPFSGSTNREIVARVLREPVVPPKERAPERNIPDLLNDLDLRCLARDPKDRFQNGEELLHAFEDVMARFKADQMAKPDPTPFIQASSSAIEQQQTYLEDAALALDEVNTAQTTLGPTANIAEKSAGWVAEEKLTQLHLASNSSFAEGLDALLQANALNPDDNEIREKLCDQLQARYEAARNRHDTMDAAYHLRLLERHHNGRCANLLNAKGCLQIELYPQGELKLWIYRERARRLLPEEMREIHSSMASLDQLEAGIYKIAGEAPGCEPCFTTAVVQAGRTTRLRLRLSPAGSTPTGYIHIPAGTFRFGPPQTRFAASLEQALPDFYISEFPVTAEEWRVFIQRLQKENPEAAARRIPKSHDGITLAWSKNKQGEWQWPTEGPLAWHAQMPVVGITLEDAEAYCEFIRTHDGIPLRLPTEEEWEKAARGVEGRLFPWGDLFEPTYAVNADTWTAAWPPAVGANSVDASPYGVRDLAGGVREWTSTRMGAGSQAVVRGGSFLTTLEGGHPLYLRDLMPLHRTAPDLGFRTVRD